MKQPWNGRVWLDPPYSNPLAKRFLEKMTEHNNGIALVFSKIEAKWFHDVVLRHATAVKFLYERTRFFRPDGEGELKTDDGTVFLPNDLYPLEKTDFRLYYTSHCSDQQIIDVYIQDNFGQVVQKTFSFQNKNTDE